MTDESVTDRQPGSGRGARKAAPNSENGASWIAVSYCTPHLSKDHKPPIGGAEAPVGDEGGVKGAVPEGLHPHMSRSYSLALAGNLGIHNS